MDTDKGLRVLLPPPIDPNFKPPDTKQYERNVLEILVNSNDQLLVEKQLMSVQELTNMVKKHITNEGRLPNFAESSTKAIVSLKNDRSTTYERYVQVYNELMRAYNEVRNDYSLNKYGRSFDDLPDNSDEADEIRKKYPLKISEAEPVAIGS
jgi:biopolymer transport protein ExbD